MNGNFYLFGGIASLVLHGALIGVLALMVGESSPSADVSSDAEMAGSETNVTASIPAPSLSSGASAPPARAPSIPLASSATPAVSSSTPDARPVERNPLAREKPPVPVQEWREYVVQPGDTLTLLAKRAGTSFTEIARANRKTVTALSRLKIGQRIKLPPFPVD